jgi:hypothetical protein
LCERLGQPHLGKEHHSSAVVSGNGCAVAEDEPPAFIPSFFGDRFEEFVGLAVGEWKQR